MHTGRLALNVILLFVLVCGQNEVLWCVCMRGVFVVEKNMCMMWGLFFEWSIMWILSLFGTLGTGTDSFQWYYDLIRGSLAHLTRIIHPYNGYRCQADSQQGGILLSEYCLLQPINSIVIILE